MKNTIKFCLLLFLLLLSGCASEKKQAADPAGLHIYTLDFGRLKLKTENFTAETKDTSKLTEALMSEMNRQLTEQLAQNPDYPDILIRNAVNEGGILTISFLEEYKKLDPDYEVLFRAAVVKTFGQVEGVQFICFRLGDQTMNKPGTDIALLMTPGQFVDIEGDSIMNYTEQTIHLYYATADGNHLKQQTQVIHYNKNLPFEQVLLQTLINGPTSGNNQYRRLLPESTKILNISISEGICYVNLDKTAQEIDPDETNPIAPAVSIYGLVNTLTENLKVDQVQLFIAGKSDVSFKDKVDLSLPLPPAWDLLEEDK